MKKHLALVLALVMVLSSFSFVSAAPDFADVQGTVYEDSVGRLELLDILKGYPDGTFRPEDTITRAEFATVAVRTLGLAGAAQSAVGLPSGFSDVPAHHWAAGYIGVAASAGVVNGIGNGLFAPEAPVKYEEAVTMLVRALGYGPEAQSRGGYPYGYLIVAEQIDLLDGVRGTQGTFATRGTVAMLTDNALELPMMVSIGFGDNIRWVVSGTERTEEVTLLDQMGFKAVEGRVVAYDDDDMEIELNDEISTAFDGTYEVMEGFDFYEYHGAVVKAWVDGDEVIAIKVTEGLMFDALEVTKAEEEIKLIDANKKYDVDADALVWINGEEADLEDLVKGQKHNFAKVGLNDDGDVMFIDGYTWDGFIVFEEADADDDFIYGADWELDIEDVLFVKGGKTITVEDLEEGDLVFYNDDADFAEVFNAVVDGEFDEIFSTTFEVDGEEFEYVLDENKFSDDIAFVQYINEDDDMADFDDEVAVQMEEEGEVAVYVDRFGDAVYVTGDLGPVQKSTFGALLYKDMAGYVDVRGRERLELAVVTEMGEEATYDFRLSDLESVKIDGTVEWDEDYTTELKLDDAVPGVKTKIRTDGTPSEDLVLFSNYEMGQVIEITVDVDGDVVGLNFFDYVAEDDVIIELDSTAESGDSYIENKRMGSDVPLFFIAEGVTNWDDEDVEVVMYGDLEEDVRLIDFDLYHDGSKALYMVVTDSDMEAVVSELAVVTQVRTNSDGDITRIRAYVGNTEITYYTEDPINETVNAGDPVKLSIIESNDRVQSIDVLTIADNEIAEFDTTSTFTATANGRKVNEYVLVSGGYIFDISDKTDIDTMSFAELNDVEVGTEITVVFENPGNNKYIKYVLVGELDGPETVAGETFSIVTGTAVVAPANAGGSFGRSVEVKVDLNHIDWATGFTADSVTVDKSLFNVAGIMARSVSVDSSNLSTEVVFTLVFEGDVWDGDTLTVAKNAITVTAVNASDDTQNATINAGTIKITVN